MDNTLNKDSNITNLKATVESLILEIQQMVTKPIKIHNAVDLEKLEKEMQAKALKLADSISAIKLQEAMNQASSDEAEKKINQIAAKKI